MNELNQDVNHLGLLVELLLDEQSQDEYLDGDSVERSWRHVHELHKQTLDTRVHRLHRLGVLFLFRLNRLELIKQL